MSATPEQIAAAWATWRARHGGKLGPGPAFAEAINAALAAKPKKPAHASMLTWDTINAISNSTSSPASRANIDCACARGDEAMRRICKDQPQCNKAAGDRP